MPDHATLCRYAREWLLDCFSDDYDQEVIQELTDAQTVRAVKRYYDGGWDAFLLANS